MIAAQPVQPRAPRRSPASVIPKSAAKTGSIVKARAVRVADVLRCAQVWTRKPSALAKTPVTSRAPHTVQPCGTPSSPRASATTPRPAQAAAISTNVKATAS
jgi:hypothetical protein